MDRYSTIRGTIASGAEMRLAESDGLSAFLQSLGALDANSVLQVVDSQLRGFERLTGYETEKQNQKPVAIRYAPMHLYKMRGMERVRPFCALSVSGVENREDRISQYSQTFVFSHEQALRGTDGYNYLDMLLGTEPLSWKTLELYRNKQASLECDSPLRKIIPKIEAHDLIVTLKTVEAIYQKKNVVIQLEPNFSFNDRALRLLAGIYSLLPPRLAVEVGYATYQRAADIPKIVERNSIRIFVLPAGESVGQLPDSFLLLDLATTPTPVKKTPLMETLVKWVQFPWERRQSAMQELFKDEREYQDETIFVQKSTACFDAIRSAEQWSRDTSKNGTISSLEELYAEYEAHQSQYVPWFDEMFRNRITALLKAPNTLDHLNAQAAEKLRTAVKEEQPQMRKVYLFGQKFGKVDINTLCNLVSEHQKSKDDIERALDREKAEAALAAEQENTRKAEEARNTAVAAEKENTRKAEEYGKAAVAVERQRAADAVAAEQENTRKAVEAGNAAVAAEKENTRKAEEDGKAAVAAERQRGADAVAAEQENTRKAVEAAKTKAAIELAQERESYRAALEAEKANTIRAKEDGEAAVAAVQQEKDALYAKASAAYKELQKHDSEVGIALQQEQQLHRQADEKAQALGAEKESLQQALSRERKNAEILNQNLAKTIHERDAAQSKISAAEDAAQRAYKEKDAMFEKQQSALAAADDAKEKLDNYKRGKYNTRLIATGGIAGLLVGALIVGGVWLCVSLFGSSKNSTPSPAPTTATVPATMATEIPETTVETEPVETTQETQVPTTEATQPATNPPIDAAALSQLPDQVSSIKTVKTDDLESWIPEPLSQEGTYQPLALLTTAESVPENAEDAADFSYALLVQQNHAEGTPDSTDSFSADLTLSDEQYILFVFGDEDMQHAAFEVFDVLIPDETQISVTWGGQRTLNLNSLVVELLNDSDWWRQLNVFSTTVQEQTPAKALGNITHSPVLYLDCSGQYVYIYDCADTPDLLAELTAATESGNCTMVQQGDFIGLAVK